MLSLHGRFIKDIWYEESIGVPLLLRWPRGLPGGRVDDSLIGLMDLMPSLCGLAGIPCPRGRDGRDLSATLRGAAPPVYQPLLLSHNTGAPPPELTRYDFPLERGMYWRGLRTRHHTYAVVDQRPESVFYDPARRDAFPPHATRVAYDLRRDPHQLAPVFDGAGDDDLLDRLHGELERRLDAVGDDFLQRYWQPTRSAKAAPG